MSRCQRMMVPGVTISCIPARRSTGSVLARSMSRNATVSLPGSSGARRRPASSSRLTFSSCSTFPQVNARRNDPSVDGARIPPISAGSAPCRSRPMSSMLSAPAIIPAARQGTFRCAFTPHRRPTRTCSAARSCKPARWASAITDQAMRHEMRVIKGCLDLRQVTQQSRVRGVLSARERGSFSNSHRPSSEGTFRVRGARIPAYLRGGSRLRPAAACPAEDHSRIRSWLIRPQLRAGRRRQLRTRSSTPARGARPA